jgi:prophage tail gpP-like protein
MTTPTLIVGGAQFDGWQSVRITRSIENAVSDFDFSSTARWPGQANPVQITPGSSCEIVFGDDLLLSGYVDVVDIAVGPSAHTISVAGRSRTAELVDCSALPELGTFRDLTLAQIAARLAAPYSVDVSADVTTRVIRKFKAQSGESVFDAIERAARLEGILVTDDAAGVLTLTRIGAASRAGDTLTNPGNVIEARGTFDASEVYSEYRCKGSRTGSDDDFGSVLLATETIADAASERTRVLIVRAEGRATSERARARAQWEAATRAGRSVSLSYTVQGWRQSNGALWRPFELVRVRDETLRVSGEFLITGVTWNLDRDGGETTNLNLSLPSAYDLIQPAPRMNSRKAGKAEPCVGVWKPQGLLAAIPPDPALKIPSWITGDDPCGKK